mgnify:CR=1 FL=1
MIINLISNLDETAKIDRLYTFNHVVAWSLREAFSERGVTCRLIRDRLMEEGELPMADHSIVISGIGMKLVRNNELCRGRLRAATRGKTTLYLDSDFGGWWKFFDCIFTVVKPLRKEPQYAYAGWGSNPKFFYPEQEEKALFIDSLMYNKYEGRFNEIYDTYKKTLKIPERTLASGDPLVQIVSNPNIKVYMPTPTYDKRHHLIFWPQMQEILRKCHFYCCTQLGESGLTRIEAATCGTLLVVPEELYRPRTMGSLEHKIWSTKEELVNILSADTDIKAIRKRALEHSWSKTAGRILDALMV